MSIEFGNSVEEGFQKGDVSGYKRLLHDIEEVVESLRRDHPGKKFYLFGHSLGCLQALGSPQVILILSKA